jgi:hypothetical protein
VADVLFGQFVVAQVDGLEPFASKQCEHAAGFAQAKKIFEVSIFIFSFDIFIISSDYFR